LKTMLARMAVDAHIRASRPFAIFIAILCLVLVGVILILISVPLLLMSLFAQYFFLIICGMFFSIGLMCFLLSWGLSRGILWAWFSTALLAPLLTFTGWRVMIKVDSTFYLLTILIIILLIIVQVIILISPVRRWFFSSNEIRSYLRDLEFLARSGESSEFAEKRAGQLFDDLYSKLSPRGQNMMQG
jgi:hypothetical protein